jgi:GPH family glycoside/pentoside/hexuronide:cation symporter
MIGAALPISLSFGLLFSIPDVSHGAGLFIYVTALYLVLRIGLSTFGLPYGALGAELTTDYHERSVLFAFRWVFNCGGNVILLVLAFLVFLPSQEALDTREAYGGFGWSCALVALLAMMTCCYAGLKMQDRVRVVTQKLNPGGTRFFHEAFEVISNRSFWVLFLCLLLFWTGQGVFNVLGIHVNLYFWKLPDEWIRALPFIGLVGYFAGIPVSTIVLRHFEKRDVSAAGLMIATVTQLLPAPLALAGLLPQGTALYLTLGVAGAVGAVAASVALIAWGSMMADAADEHEHLFGARREGLYFSGLTLSQKSAAGLGGLVGGMALDGIGFPRDVAAVGVENIPADAILNLGIVQGPLAALLSIAGVTILLRYRLNRREIARIQSDLAVRTQARKIESQLE